MTPNPETVSADELREAVEHFEGLRELISADFKLGAYNKDACDKIVRRYDITLHALRELAALRQGRQGVSEVVGWQVRERNAEGWSMWSYTSKETATMFRSDPARYSWVEVRDLVVAPMLAQGKDAQAVGIGDWARTQATMHAHHATPIQPTSAPSAIPAGHLTDDQIADIAYKAGWDVRYEDYEGDETDEPHVWGDEGDDCFGSLRKFAHKLTMVECSPPLAVLTELVMVSDPWPLQWGRDILTDWLDSAARTQGYEDWLDAYHKVPR